MNRTKKNKSNDCPVPDFSNQTDNVVEALGKEVEFIGGKIAQIGKQRASIDTRHNYKQFEDLYNMQQCYIRELGKRHGALLVETENLP